MCIVPSCVGTKNHGWAAPLDLGFCSQVPDLLQNGSWGTRNFGAGNPHPREHIQAVVGASISNGAHAWCLGRRLRSTMGSIVNPWAPRVDRIRSSAAGIDHPWIVADIRVPVVDAAEERFLAKEKLLASNLLQKRILCCRRILCLWSIVCVFHHF